MLFRLSNNFNFKNTKFLKSVDGLIDFQKSLELGYFSEITIKNNGSDGKNLDYVLEFNCPLNLLDVLGHFNKGLWGSNDSLKSTFSTSFGLLLKQNEDLNIDIQEVTLCLNDVNIVIKKIHEHSIPGSFNGILCNIAKNYVSITKGLTEQPEEIFIPVIEDNVATDDAPPVDFHENSSSPSSYIEYWGIYMESEVDGLIFDVQNSKFIPANLDYYMFDENN